VRKAEVFLRAGLVSALLCVAVAVMPGCGSKTGSSAEAGATPTKVHKKPKVATGKPGETNLADMVAAVSAAKAGPPVEMKFSLSARPEVGQVIDLDVALIPRAPIPDSVSASFQAFEGLEIIEGAQLERIDKLVDGTPVHHLVKILAKRDGIFAVTAAVSISQSSQDLVRTFSIPVIAGEGLPEQVAKGP